MGYFRAREPFPRLMIRDAVQVRTEYRQPATARRNWRRGVNPVLSDLAEYGSLPHLRCRQPAGNRRCLQLPPQYATKLGIKPDEVEQYY